MAQIRRRYQLQGANFRARVNGFTSFIFRSISELSMELEKIEIREGGRILPVIELGLGSSTDVTFERVKAIEPDMILWWERAIDAKTGLGELTESLREDVDIEQLDRDGGVMATVRIYRCLPIKYVRGAWDAGTSEPVIESLTLAHEGMKEVTI
jgi:phage tail-like protein